MIYEYYLDPGMTPGMIEASGSDEAKKLLYSRGVSYRQLKPASPLDLRIFWTLLSALSELVNHGFSIHRALEVIDQSPSRKLTQAVRRVHFYLKAGRPLTESLQRVFPKMPLHIIEMLAVGEASANLGQTMKHLCTTHSQQRIEFNKIREALMYPSIVLMTAVVVCWILFDYIVPGFAGLLSPDNSSNHLTSLVFRLAGRVGPTIEFSVWCVVVFLSLWWVASRQPRIRFWMERILFCTPIIQTLIIGRERIKFLGVWSMGLSAGLSADRSLEFAYSALQNVVIRERVYQALSQIRAGFPIDQALRETDLLRPHEIFRLHLGLEAGSTAEAVAQVSMEVSRESLHRLRVLTNLAGPVSIILLGIAIGAIAFGVLVPIFSLQSTIHTGV